MVKWLNLLTWNLPQRFLVSWLIPWELWVSCCPLGCLCLPLQFWEWRISALQHLCCWEESNCKKGYPLLQPFLMKCFVGDCSTLDFQHQARDEQGTLPLPGKQILLFNLLWKEISKEPEVAAQKCFAVLSSLKLYFSYPWFSLVVSYCSSGQCVWVTHVPSSTALLCHSLLHTNFHPQVTCTTS